MGAFDRKMVELLRCALGPQELVRKAAELASHLQETARVEEGKAAHVKAMAEQIKERKLQQASLANDIATESEDRPVECMEVPRYADMLVDIVRCDTGKVERTRAMQPSERQASLRLVEQDEFERQMGIRDEDETPSRKH